MSRQVADEQFNDEAQHISQEEQERVVEPDYWVVGEDNLAFGIWNDQKVYTLLSKVSADETGLVIWVCPWEEVQDIPYGPQRNAHCREWAENFAAL